MKTRRTAGFGPVMTVAEVAQYLKVHPTTLYKLVRRHQIPAFKIGSDYRFDKDATRRRRGRSKASLLLDRLEILHERMIRLDFECLRR